MQIARRLLNGTRKDFIRRKNLVAAVGGAVVWWCGGGGAATVRRRGGGAACANYAISFQFATAKSSRGPRGGEA